MFWSRCAKFCCCKWTIITYTDARWPSHSRLYVNTGLVSLAKTKVGTARVSPSPPKKQQFGAHSTWDVFLKHGQRHEPFSLGNARREPVCSGMLYDDYVFQTRVVVRPPVRPPPPRWWVLSTKTLVWVQEWPLCSP